MKLTAPCMTGQENVLDFPGPRGHASPELKELINRQTPEQSAQALNQIRADRAIERLAAMRGLTPAQYREKEIADAVTKISEAMQVVQRSLKKMQTYYSEAAMDAYVVGLQEMLPKLTGGSCGNE